MIGLLEELGATSRVLLRRPRTLVLPVAILATGIGLSVATFSVIQGVLLRGLPVEGSDRLVMVSTGTGPDRSSRLSDIELLRKASEAGEGAFEKVAASVAVNSVVTGVEGPSFGRSGAYVSGDLFPLLGVEPLLGRIIGPSDAEPDAPRISLLSYRFWQSSFGGDPDVIGTELVVNRAPTTIVGVMPPGFGFPVREDFWTVLQPEATELRIAMAHAIARLAGGRTLSDARSEVAQIARSLDESDPIYRARSHSVTPYAVASVAPATRRALGVLLVAAIAVLLVACVNVANLRLASAAARSQELAVRGALGAGRSRLVAMMVAESIVVAVLAAATGLGIAWILVEEAGRALLQGSLLRGYWIDIRLDAAVVAAALVLALGSTLLAGVLPALVAIARGGPAEALRPGIRGVGVSTRAFVVFQIGLCFALTVAAGALTRSAQALLHSDPGLDGEHLVTSWITLFQDRGLEPEDRARFYEELVRRLEARPEVARAAVGESPPWGRAAIVESTVGGPERLEAPGDHPLVRVLRIGPRFVATAGLRLLSGREPTREELRSRDQPALVSASFARRRFGSLGQAIGAP